MTPGQRLRRGAKTAPRLFWTHAGQRAAYRAAVAHLLGVPTSAVTVTARAASIIVTSAAVMPSDAAAANASTLLRLTPAEALSTALGAPVLEVSQVRVS